MTLSHLFMILRGRWKFGLSIWSVAMLAAVIAVLLMPPQYMSTGSIVVNSKAIDPLAGIVLNNNGVLPGNMATQASVAESSRVILAAVKALNLDHDPALLAEWRRGGPGRGKFDVWLVNRLSKKYVVTTSRDSNVLELAFTAPSPDFAAAMTNALMQAYIETTLEMRIESAKQYSQFFDARSRQLRESLEQAQTRLSTYQQQNGLMASDQSYDVENARLSELNSHVTGMQSALADTAGRQREAQTNPQRMQEVQTNPVVVSLSGELGRANARVEELRSRLGENNPELVAAKSNSDELRSRLAAATSLASAGISASNSVARDRLAQAVTALDEQRRKVLALKSKRDAASVLQRDVESAQRAYDSTLARLSQTEMESESRQSDVAVLQVATPAASPASPKKSLIVSVAFLGGLMLALVATVVLEMMNRRLRTEEDITLSLGQSLLIVVPKVKLPTVAGSRRLDQLKTRVLSGLVSTGRS